MTHIAPEVLQHLEKHLSASAEPLLAVIGPTGSGKTAFSIALGQSLPGIEILNGDSRQLYKYLDIGTAKITKEEQKGIPHHLLDVLDPSEEVTAGWYQARATEVIEDVLQRGKIPMIVGGSMLYISTILDNLSLAPTHDPALREKLMKDYDTDSGVTLHKRLSELDPETAGGIPVQNKPRLVRAVELCELLHSPRSQSVPSTELRKGQSHPRYDLYILGMDVNRPELHRRIEQRAESMLDSGWIEEVQELLGRGYTADDPGMKSHGYREIIQHLSNPCASLEKLTQTIAAKTRQYAKRQMTWWKGDSRIRWVGVGSPSPVGGGLG